MPYALMTSGGKDSTLALDRARRRGLDVTCLVNIYEGTSGRVRFHGTPQGFIEQQAASLDLDLVTAHTSPEDFEQVFHDMLHTLEERGVTGVIFGNVHLADVRAWYEDRVRDAGFEHVEPLWGDPPIEIAWEFVERGYRALVVSVDLAQRAREFLGREFDADLVTELGVIDDLDPCGERGEYHTFVFDGPAFAHPIPFAVGEHMESDGHRFLDLVPAHEGAGRE